MRVCYSRVAVFCSAAMHVVSLVDEQRAARQEGHLRLVKIPFGEIVTLQACKQSEAKASKKPQRDTDE